MEKTYVSQKDYLKKYLDSGINKKEKKHKKKLKLGSKKVKIIDDDAEIQQKQSDDYETELAILNADEDAPQVVGEFSSVDFNDKKKWKTIINNNDDCSNDRVDQSVFTLKDNELDQNHKIRNKNLADSKLLSKKSHSRDDKPVRNGSDSDLSPPRPSRNSVKRSNNSDLDLSPPRRSKKDRYRSSRHSDSDLSPPRKSKKHRHRSDSADSDLDLPRSRSKQKSQSRSYNKEHRRSNSGKHNSDSDLSPPRKTSSKRYDKSRHRSRSRSSTPDFKRKRLTKTLDGRTAGLQNAQDLRRETVEYKKQELKYFDKMNTMGKFSQETVVRDRKTGKRRDLEAENARREENEQKQKIINEKYEKWGRGLKQVDDRTKKLQDDIYEFSKPLARYADDADLDAQLRAVEREGDPMLDYIKQKQIKENKRKPDVPLYQGSYMPNRFGIRPGRRWDGVDRSNGYEKKWFEMQNMKQANQEEAYKWSTADM